MKWKDIPGWEGFYQVSDHGWVRSMPRKLKFRRLEQRFTRKLPGQVLKIQISTKGYFKVSLTRPGKRIQPLVHGLVLRTFLGPRPAGLQACHNDGDKSNNRKSNLRYDTCQSNIDDRERHRKSRWKRS